jgi:diguanylate cyclase (GGDEF)-like protein/PAS domain S-box-containing protein
MTDDASSASGRSDEVERLFELSRDLVATFGRDGRFGWLNGAWEEVLGWSLDEIRRGTALDLVHPEDRERTLALSTASGSTADVQQFENRYRCKDGTYRWLEWNARRWKDRWYAVGRDVTERRALEHQALRDPLTGLPNRALFVDRLAQALARLERKPGVVAVLFVDLDRFKIINDSKGHEVGDRFLRAAAKRLLEALRGTDSVARLGGDEFVLLVQDQDGRGARNLAEIGARVVATLERPFVIDGEELAIGASVGISATANPTVAPETLLREADIAMYHAKGLGGGRCAMFDAQMRSEVAERVQVQAELERALELGELCVHYQPIVALPEMAVVRCEALVRWQHPARGLLLPHAFVPLAEETGLIVPIGEWVLNEACRQAQEWRRAGRNVGITVNVSTRQLGRADIVDVVSRALARSGLPAPALCLEITETAIMERTEQVVPGLVALRKLGVRVAMDDFGSGYSSLSYVRSLPLDIIKIDKSFVAGVPTSAEDRAIVTAILSLARQTELAVIAEGIETELLHRELVGLGCGLGQGFLYDRPQAPELLRLDGYSSRVGAGVGDPLVIREFMRQIGIPARITQ